MPSIICDSSSLISLSETCLIDVLRFLRDSRLGGRFLITPVVKHEIVSHPMQIPQHEFSAIRLQKLLDDRVVEVVSTPGLAEQTKKILSLANNLFSVRGRPLEILQEGEAECLAAFAGMSADGLLVDEKTTRMLVEDPLKLAESIGREYAGRPQVNESALTELRELTRGIFVTRSSELLAVAGGQGFFKEYRGLQEHALRAALLTLRNAGCSLTTDELREYSQMRV